jgi:basic membrane protein A
VEDWDHPSQPAGDPAAELESLQHVRDELWIALRNEDDPEARMPLLSRLSENRAAILRLGEQLGSEHAQRLSARNGQKVARESPGASDPPAGGVQRPQRGRVPSRPQAAPAPPKSIRPALLALGGLATVLALTWLALARPSGDGTASADLAAPAGDGTDPAGPDLAGTVAEIAAVLQGLGLTDVQVEQQGSVIHLSGAVLTEAEMGAALGAAQALAVGNEIDGSGLVIQAGDGAGLADPAARADALQAEIGRITAVTPVIFGEGATELTDLHIRILNNVAMIIAAYPATPVQIVGYTDVVGTDGDNHQLSLSRAEAVRDYLVSRGVPESQLNVEAAGETRSTGSQALANLERRVEFEVTAPAGPVAMPASEATLRIAVVAPSARNDVAFSQSMVDAVNAIASERGNVEITVTDDTVVPDVAAAAIAEYAADGYDLVIAHGSQFGGSLVDIAPQHPDVVFAWGTASDTFGLPNVYAYDAAAEQGGYVMGTMSSLLSNSGTVGVVGPIEVGDAQRYVNGFEAGAEAASSSTEVLVTYTGSFSDLTLAAETAQAHTAAGADVMTGSAQMVVGAVAIAEENDVLWFGTQSNQAMLAPDLVVASQVYHWEVILRQIVADIDAGAVGGTTNTAELANGGLVVEFNPGFPLGADIRQRADQVVADIVNKTLDVPTLIEP